MVALLTPASRATAAMLILSSELDCIFPCCSRRSASSSRRRVGLFCSVATTHLQGWFEGRHLCPQVCEYTLSLPKMIQAPLARRYAKVRAFQHVDLLLSYPFPDVYVCRIN